MYIKKNVTKISANILIFFFIKAIPAIAGQISILTAVKYKKTPSIFGYIATQYSKQKIIRSLFVRSIPSNEPEEKNKIKIQNEFFLIFKIL